jgi:hypothetical protein
MAPRESGALRTQISFSGKERADIAVAVLCDCVNSLGAGVKSGDSEPDMSWAQEMQFLAGDLLARCKKKIGLSDVEVHEVRRLVRDGLTVSMMRTPTSTVATALFMRMGSFALHHPDHEDAHAASRAIINHALVALAGPVGPQPLQSVGVVVRALRGAKALHGDVSWRVGVTTQDVHAACRSNLLVRETLERAHQMLRRWAKGVAKDLFGEQDWSVHRDDAAEVLAETVKEWVPSLRNETDALIVQLRLYLEHETDVAFTLDSDVESAVLGIHAPVSMIDLGDGRSLTFSPLVDLDPARRPPEEESKFLEEQEAEAGDDAGVARASDLLLGDKFYRGHWDAVQPVSRCRVLVVWRGSPVSAVAAREALPHVIRSAVRTAAMSQNMSEGLLELVVSPHYMSPGHDMRSANIDESHYLLNIGLSPRDFPVAMWLELALDETLRASSSPCSFAGNASRLLLDADDLLDVSPQQSFVCSVSAIEACLGSKGEAVASRLARSVARLLCPDTKLRSGAESMFKRLYDTRSRVVHGDRVYVDRRNAVFMRFIASCVVYNVAGFVRGQVRMGAEVRQDTVQRFLGEQDVYSSAVIPGTNICPLLHELLADPERRLHRWMPTGE